MQKLSGCFHVHTCDSLTCYDVSMVAELVLPELHLDRVLSKVMETRGEGNLGQHVGKRWMCSASIAVAVKLYKVVRFKCSDSIPMIRGK